MKVCRLTSRKNFVSVAILNLIRMVGRCVGGTLKTGSIVGVGDFCAGSVDDVVVESGSRHLVSSPVQAARRAAVFCCLEDRRSGHSCRMEILRSR